MSSVMDAVESLFQSPVFLAVSAALFTALVAPYLIERTKANISKRETIVATQFEIVESLIALSSRYVVSAKFLVVDFFSDRLVERAFVTHLSNYEVTSEETFRNLQVQAYRARMYFGDARIYEMVMDLYSKIADVDYDILRVVDKRNSKSEVIDEATKSEAQRISNAIGNLNFASVRVVEFLFARTGKIPSTIQTNSAIETEKELPTR